MSERARTGGDLWFVFFYPLAAFLLFYGIGKPGWPRYLLGRDWPYVLAGPAGVFAWWLTAKGERTLAAVGVGYLAGALVCLVIVVALRVLAARLRKPETP